MPPRDDYTSLKQMLDHAKEAVLLVAGMSRRELESDRKSSLAVVRLLEIVGEAANRISAETQTQYDFIPWADIISLRNRLIHGYDAVDMNILWGILSQDVPELVNSLQKILSSQ